jgi:hypothetical protein
MGQALPAAPSGTAVVMTDFYQLNVLGYLLATHWLPSHLWIWEISPWIAGLIAGGILSRAVSAIYCSWAGWMVFILLTAAGPELLQLQFEWDGHAFVCWARLRCCCHSVGVNLASRV